MMSTILLACTQAMATIVDGVRQKPEVPKSGFAANTEAYLYNVGSGLYFTEGNSWGTQASVGETGLVIKFTTTATNGVYLFNDYSIVKMDGKKCFLTLKQQCLSTDKTKVTIIGKWKKTVMALSGLCPRLIIRQSTMTFIPKCTVV